MNVEEVKERAFDLLLELGFPRNVMSLSPFQMSGGQMRKIAIVSILAMNPDVIVLDEPTAGLDPKSRQQVMELFKEIQLKQNKTIILVSHDMNEVAKYAEEIIVMNDGNIIEQVTPKELFRQGSKLEEWHIALPDIVQLQRDIEIKHGIKFKTIALTEKEFVSMYQSGNIMKNKLIIGRYLPNNSVIHHLDPRAKVLFVFMFIILIFLLILCNVRVDYFINFNVYVLAKIKLWF